MDHLYLYPLVRAVLQGWRALAERLHGEGKIGCTTVFDIAPAYLSPLSGEELRARLL